MNSQRCTMLQGIWLLTAIEEYKQDWYMYIMVKKCTAPRIRNVFIVLCLVQPLTELAIPMCVFFQRAWVTSLYVCNSWSFLQKSNLLPQWMQLTNRHVEKAKKDIKKSKADVHAALMKVLSFEQKKYYLDAIDFAKKHSNNAYLAQQNALQLMLVPFTFNPKNFYSARCRQF